MSKGETVIDPATGKAHVLAAEYAAVLDHLQGEKERVTAKQGSRLAADPAADEASSSQQQIPKDKAAAASSSSHGIATTAADECSTSSQAGPLIAVTVAGSRHRSIEVAAGESSLQLQQHIYQPPQQQLATNSAASATGVSARDNRTLQLYPASSNADVSADVPPCSLPPCLPRLSSICTSVMSASGVCVAGGGGDVVMSPEGPVMRWEKFLAQG